VPAGDGGVESHTQPNKGMEPIAYSLRYAAASGNGSCLAFGCGSSLQTVLRHLAWR